MIQKILYRQPQKDGTVIHSLEKPQGEYTTLFRFIADEGKTFTKDYVNFTTVIDGTSLDGWYEVEHTEEEKEVQKL